MFQVLNSVPKGLFEALETIQVVRVTRHIHALLEVVDLEKCQIIHPYCG